VGKGHDFSCGRQFCAWLGLVPGQYSSGGKQRLGRITKAGDPYLRTLLIMGGKAVVAIAAKNARVCWAMLQQGDAFRLPA
jgi:transposase